jgi:hypothetical protein
MHLWGFGKRSEPTSQELPIQDLLNPPIKDVPNRDCYPFWGRPSTASDTNVQGACCLSPVQSSPPMLRFVSATTTCAAAKDQGESGSVQLAGYLPGIVWGTAAVAVTSVESSCPLQSQAGSPTVFTEHRE